MNWQYCCSAVRYTGFDFCRIHEESVRIRINKNRKRFIHENNVIAGNECKGRNQHFISGINANCFKSRNKRSCATGCCQTSFYAHKLCISLFKICNMFAIASPPSAGAKHFSNIFFSSLIPDRPLRPGTGMNLFSSIDRQFLLDRVVDCE